MMHHSHGSSQSARLQRPRSLSASLPLTHLHTIPNTAKQTTWPHHCCDSQICCSVSAHCISAACCHSNRGPPIITAIAVKRANFPLESARTENNRATNLQLGSGQVDVGHHLGARVFHLKTRVELQEIEAAVLAVEVLDCTGTYVTHHLSQLHCALRGELALTRAWSWLVLISVYRAG